MDVLGSFSNSGIRPRRSIRSSVLHISLLCADVSSLLLYSTFWRERMDAHSIPETVRPTSSSTLASSKSVLHLFLN